MQVYGQYGRKGMIWVFDHKESSVEGLFKFIKARLGHWAATSKLSGLHLLD